MTPSLPEFDLPAVEMLLEVVTDGVWFWHADSGYVYRSPGWYKMLGYSPHSLENTVLTWESVIHPEDYPRVMKHFEEYITGACDRYDIEYRCRKQNGDFLWIRDTGLIVDRNADDTVLRMVGAHHDIDAFKRLQDKYSQEKQSLEEIITQRTKDLDSANQQLKEKVRELELNAHTDYLTSLLNRRGFEQKLQNEFARANRFREPLVMIIIDLDEFKSINDQHGHPTGDELLTEVGKILLNNLREIDVSSRWGGDEFALLLPNTNMSDGLSVAEKLRIAINDRMQEMKLPLTASLGVVELSAGESVVDFVRRADMALYISKNSGRNTVSVSA